MEPFKTLKEAASAVSTKTDVLYVREGDKLTNANNKLLAYHIVPGVMGLLLFSSVRKVHAYVLLQTAPHDHVSCYPTSEASALKWMRVNEANAGALTWFGDEYRTEVERTRGTSLCTVLLPLSNGKWSQLRIREKKNNLSVWKKRTLLTRPFPEDDADERQLTWSETVNMLDRYEQLAKTQGATVGMIPADLKKRLERMRLLEDA